MFRLTYPSTVTSGAGRPRSGRLRSQRHPGDAQAGGDVPARIRPTQPLTDLVCSMLADAAFGDFVQAALLRQPRNTKGPQILAENPKLFAGAIVQAGEDIRRTFDLLASRPEVNPGAVVRRRTGLRLVGPSAAGAEPADSSGGLDPGGGRSVDNRRRRCDLVDDPETAARPPHRGRSGDRLCRPAALPRPCGSAGAGRPRADDQRRRR